MANKNCITLDGRMEDKAWENAQVYADFKRMKSEGDDLGGAPTVFKILPMEDRIYFGFQCIEPDMRQVIDNTPGREVQEIWGADRVELFFAPTGSTYEYYQFVMFFSGKTVCNYYAEGGQIRPEPYAPEWKSAVYVGEDHWSVVAEIPLTALYMTPNDSMGDTWLVNAIRCRTQEGLIRPLNSSICELNRKFTEVFLPVAGMPKRPVEDDIRIVSATPNLTEKDGDGYRGTMTVKTLNGVDGAFTFTSDHGEAAEVSLKAGTNEFEVPCYFAELGRHQVSLALTRAGDGKVFKRYYPVIATYEPIKLRFTCPEYRCNFYPGQDYSKIVGTVTAAKPVTLKLEGPGIETQVKTPNADGSFTFDTPNFEEGEAWLTATIDGEEKKQKIRRLAPTGHTMAWISGGNLIVNGKPVLARNMFSPGYLGSRVLAQRYAAENFHETREVCGQSGWMAADTILVRELKMSAAEVREDIMPCDEVLRFFDKQIKANAERDFVYYYINDEPECRGVSPIYLQNVYNYISDHDPYHVIMTTSRSASNFIEAVDWVQTHPYIDPENMPDGRRVYMRPMNTIGSFIDDIAKLNRSDKCIGFLPTAFSYKFSSNYADYPTLDEIICHTWAATNHGSKTLHPYAYHDMNDRPSVIEGMRYLFSSFEALEELVLLGKRTILLRTNDAEAALYDCGDERMFVLVNFTQAPQTVTVDGISGTWHNFRHNSTFTGNTFELKPLEVLVGTNVVKDAGLPTYEETAALIDKLEYERTHGGSLLFERHNDVEVNCVGMTNVSGLTSNNRYRFFDGVRENLGATILKQGERYCEVNLTKVQPTFRKAAISGWNLQNNVTLKLCIDGEWIEPDIAQIEANDRTTTFILKDGVSPEAIRFDFFCEDYGEIFEIEVFA
ncbi:MAG: hypothetical protein E7421_00325 [Ruminococcaceae bacterium]|nr:hypothetical protein [Oscillospiraceae bacterium]